MNYSTPQALLALRKDDREAFRAAHDLRAKADIREQSEALGKLPLDDPRIQRYVTGTCFAWDWKNVWHNFGPPQISNSQKAVNWFTAVATRFAAELQAHAKLRTALVEAVLHAHWEDAEKVLKRHQETFGHTMWEMSWLILLAEESRGAQVKSELLERFESEEFGKAVPIFARFFGLSGDRTLPEEHFRRAIRNYLADGDGAVRQFLELFLLEDSSKEWKAWEALEYSELMPLIDRYEFFIRLTAVAYGSRHADAVKLGRAASRLAGVIADPYLDYIADCAEDAAPFEAVCGN